MKKLIFLAVVMIGFSVVSCGTKTSNAKETQDSTKVALSDTVKKADTSQVIPVVKLADKKK